MSKVSHLLKSSRGVHPDIYGFSVGIGPALQSRLSPFILGNPDMHMQNDVQPRAIRLVKVPEYFANFREMGDGLAAFLGSTIVAKVVSPFVVILWVILTNLNDRSRSMI